MSKDHLEVSSEDQNENEIHESLAFPFVLYHPECFSPCHEEKVCKCGHPISSIDDKTSVLQVRQRGRKRLLGQNI